MNSIIKILMFANHTNRDSFSQYKYLEFKINFLLNYFYNYSDHKLVIIKKDVNLTSLNYFN